MLSEEIISQIKKSLPKSLIVGDMDVVGLDYVETGIDDFTGASNQMRFRVKLESWDADMRVQLTIWTNDLSKLR